MPVRQLWIVRNPGPDSTLADILFRLPVDDLGDYAIGAGPGAWRSEMHSVYVSEDEARQDAEARMRAVAKGLHLVRRADGRVLGVTVPGKEPKGGG